MSKADQSEMVSESWDDEEQTIGSLDEGLLVLG